LQQVGDVPEIIVDVAHLPNNGKPHTTEAILREFSERGLRTCQNVYKYSSVPFGYRGIVRNKQIWNAFGVDADWIFFADCDNVYHPEFFSKLKGYLENTKATNCITSSVKDHTDVPETNLVMDSFDEYIVIDNAYELAGKISVVRTKNKKIAAGCMQVVRPKDIQDKNHGVYVEVDKCKDRNMLEQGQRAKSDIQFRRYMGGTTNIPLPKQIHLNHLRDKEEGRHLEEQR